MNTNSVMATIQPLRGSGTGVISAFSILKRRLARGIEIAERIGEKRHDFVGGNAALARDFDRLRSRVVGTHDLACRTEVSVGINHNQ